MERDARRILCLCGIAALIAVIAGVGLLIPGVVEPSESATKDRQGGRSPSAPGSHRLTRDSAQAARRFTPYEREPFAALPAVAAAETAPDDKGEFTRSRMVRTDGVDPYVLVESRLCRSPAGGSEERLFSRAMVADEVMVQLKPGADVDDMRTLVARHGGQLIRKIYGTEAYLIKLPRADLRAVPDAIEFFSAQTDVVAAAECNGISFPDAVPNDTLFSDQWNLCNTGQSLGTVGADIDAVKAWNLTVGTGAVVVAVLDSGITYTHEDLAANIWSNADEIAGNAIDDDSNGLVDDFRGWDFGSGDNDPMDDFGHGTLVAGVVGGKGSNSVGIAGVCWNTSIMAVKMSYNSTNGASYTADMISSIYYAVSNGAHIISFSYGGSSNDLMRTAITVAQNAGLLFVCGAGNSGQDCDVTPFYPCAYTNPNIIAVASVDRSDQLWTGAGPSGYGATTVDLGAPGVEIICATRPSGYAGVSGTSVAIPHVSGVAALLKAVNPSWGWREIKEAILANTDPLPTLSGKCVTGGRLNAYRAIAGSVKLGIDRSSTSTVQLTWNALSNAEFQVQGSSNLCTNAWYDIGSPIPGMGTSTNLLQDISSSTNLFYRLKVQ